MVDYGTDFHGTTDIDPALSIVSGRVGLAESIVRRLSSQRGTMLGDATYGYDLRLLIGSVIRPFEVEAKVLEQVFAEEGVEDARVAIAFDEQTSTLTVRLDIRDAEGPFRLTLTVNELTVESLLEAA